MKCHLYRNRPPMRRKPLADLFGKTLAELQRLLPDSLVADKDAGGGQHLLDRAQAQGKPETKPDGMADDLSREAAASVTRMTGRFHPSCMPQPGHPPANLTVSFGPLANSKSPQRQDHPHPDQRVLNMLRTPLLRL
jgi:hypothetical protein